MGHLPAIDREKIGFLYPYNCCQVDRGMLISILIRFVRALTRQLPLLVLSVSLCSADPLPKMPHGLIWQTSVNQDASLRDEVELLLAQYEKQSGVRLRPGSRGKVALKLNTRSGRGLATPQPLIRALVAAFEDRGFSRQSILLLDKSGYALNKAGFLTGIKEGAQANFEGCPVLALDSNAYFNPNWFYDSPLPGAMQSEASVFYDQEENHPKQLANDHVDRKSFLPMPLLMEVDFWINLATVADDPVLGVDGALANATLWNVGNSKRFMANEATASAALAEIAAIPELNERLIFHIVSLSRIQYIGGPFFNSHYLMREPLLWLSSDAVALDRLIFDKINYQRMLDGFPLIDPLPRQFSFAASLNLGTCDTNEIHLQTVERVSPK